MIVARISVPSWDRVISGVSWKEMRKEFSTPAAALKWIESLDSDAEIISIYEIHVKENLISREVLNEMVK